jgi:hypothetical protein
MNAFCFVKPDPHFGQLSRKGVLSFSRMYSIGIIARLSDTLQASRP